MSSCNLLEAPWIAFPGTGDGAKAEELGVEEALLRAGDLGNPLVDFAPQFPAILRQVLLPVVVHALGAPRSTQEWGRRFEQRGFSEDEKDELRRYLAEHRARFDLFDPVAPFGQAGGLRTAKDETKGSAALVATAASGNNVPLFSTRTDADPLALSPAQAAHWLLHTLCWDTAAIKTGAADDPQVKGGKTTGNPTGPLGQLGVIVPMGRTLYETLLLNIPVTGPGALGAPQWCRPAPGPAWQQRAADGLLDLWTWQSRRIRLIPDDPDGDSEPLTVSRVVVCAGDRLAGIPEWEPHTAWTFTAPAKKGTASQGVPQRRPRRHVPGKAAWRGLEALLTPYREQPNFETSVLLDQIAALQDEGHIDADYPLQVHTFGIAYGTQSAVVEDVLHDAIPLPLLALKPDSEIHGLLIDIAEQSEKLAWAVNNLSADLRRAAGADPIPWDKGQRPGEFVLHRLDPVVRRVLAGVGPADDNEASMARARLAWEREAARRTRAVSDQLLDAAPAGTFAGRTVEVSGKKTTYSLGTAAENFRRQLDGILPRQAEAARDAATASRAADTAGLASATPSGGTP